MGTFTDEQRQEIEKMTAGAVKGVQVRNEASFNLIEFKLDKILEQTTKHNNRMNKTELRVENLEKNELTHYDKCPLGPRMRKIEDKNLSKSSVDKWLLRIGGGVVMILTIIVLLQQIA